MDFHETCFSGTGPGCRNNSDLCIMSLFAQTNHMCQDHNPTASSWARNQIHLSHTTFQIQFKIQVGIHQNVILLVMGVISGLASGDQTSATRPTGIFSGGGGYLKLVIGSVGRDTNLLLSGGVDRKYSICLCSPTSEFYLCRWTLQSVQHCALCPSHPQSG